MKYLTSFMLFFSFLQSFGQFVPVNLKIDFAGGNHFFHSQLTDGYEIEKIVPQHISAGLDYLLRSNLHLRGDIGVNLNRPSDGSPYFRNDYFRATAGVSSNLLQLNLLKAPSQKNSVRLWQDRFKIFGFVGAGVSAMINKVKFATDYEGRIYVYDYMINLCASVAPTYQINKYSALFVRAMMIGHIRQAYNFDLMGGNYNRGFDGGFMTLSIGYSFTPFQSMSGVRTVN